MRAPMSNRELNPGGQVSSRGTQPTDIEHQRFIITKADHSELQCSYMAIGGGEFRPWTIEHAHA